jgi:hypothetical protein
VWDGHPHHSEAAGFLASVRRQAVSLRERVEAHNGAQPRPPGAVERRFIAYVGQGVISEESIDGKEDE